MKKFLYIILTVFILTLFVQSQYARRDVSFSYEYKGEFGLMVDQGKRGSIYDAYSDSILTFLSQNKHRNALTIAREMYGKALKAKDNYGLFCSYRAMATIYFQKGDSALMSQNVNSALEYATRCHPQPSVTGLYHMLYRESFSYYNIDHTRDNAILLHALQGAQSDEDRFRANIYLAYDYGRQNMWEGYFKYLHQAEKYYTPEFASRFSNIYYRTISYKYLYENDIVTAMEERKKISDPIDRFSSIFNIARYKTPQHLGIAINYADSIDSLNAVNSLRNDNATLLEFEAMLNNSLLQSQADEQSARLLAAQVEAGREKMLQQQLEKENQEKILKGKQLEQEQKAKETELMLSAAEVQKRKTLMAQREQKMREQSLRASHDSTMQDATLLTIIVVALMLFVSLLVWWLLRYRKMKRRVSELNIEESRLHAIAVEASEQKNEFIKNMSHEVRTPLNNVSGFAQLLAQPEGMLTDEERAEYGRLISEDSMMLTEYINSILDTSRKEYTKKHSGILALLPIAVILMFSFIFGSRSVVGETYSSSTPFNYDTLFRQAHEKLYNNHSLSALYIVRQLNHQAHVENNIEQRFKIYMLFADIFIKRNSFDDIVPNYKKALEANKLMGNTENPYNIYNRLFDYSHRFMATDEQRLNFLDSALKYDPTDVAKASTLIRIANFYGAKNDTAMFRYYYAKFDSVARLQYNKNIERYDPVYNHVKHSRRITSQVYMNLFDNNQDAALQAIYKLNKRDEKFRMLRDYYLLIGDEARSLDYRDSLNAEMKRLHEERDIIDRQDLNLLMGNDSLSHSVAQHEADMNRLELSRQQMTIRQHQLEMDRSKQEAENSRLEMDARMKDKQLQLSKSQIEQRQAELNRQDMAMRNESLAVREREIQFTKSMLSIVSSILLLAAVIVIVIILFNRSKMRQIHSLTKKLRGSRMTAVKATEMKDLFIQNMSHEIRTPLNAITGFSQLLSLPYGTFSEEETQQFATYIHHNIRLLTMLIDDILNIGKIERGDYEMNLGESLVNETVRMAIATVEYRVPSDVSLSFTSDIPDTMSINTDSKRMQQIVINFLTNACKHTQEGTIKVHVTERDGNIEVSVADTGEGIPREQADNIFQRFVKLDQFVQGTGLGLNICRILSEKLGGRVWLDTTYPYDYQDVEHGARFVLELPAK